MLTPKNRFRFNSGHDEADRLTITTSDGGSADNDAIDVIVMPVISWPWPTVTRLTPPTRRRIACRNSPDDTSQSRQTPSLILSILNPTQWKRPARAARIRFSCEQHQSLHARCYGVISDCGELTTCAIGRASA